MLRPILAVSIAGIVAAILMAAPAHAQATRTWVSGVGDDVNPCSRTAPCKTFAGAISKTAAGGEINCLDPGGFGGVTTIKSMTFNCVGTFGSILVAGTPGITINAGVNDRVVVRGINITGINQTAVPGTIGIRILGAASVSVEDCVITSFGQQGIIDSRTAANVKLSVRNTIVSSNSAAGIALFATAGGFTVLDNVLALNNTHGVNVGASNNVLIKNSVLSGNGGNGVTASGGQVQINASAISNNIIGLNSSGGAIRVGDSDFLANGTAFSGPVQSSGNNRLTGPVGTAPTPVSGI